MVVNSKARNLRIWLRSFGNLCQIFLVKFIQLDKFQWRPILPVAQQLWVFSSSWSQIISLPTIENRFNVPHYMFSETLMGGHLLALNGHTDGARLIWT